MNPVRIYDYLVTCRGRLLDAARPLTTTQWTQEFPIGLKSIGATLTHLMISEWYYIERLEGRDVPPYETWPIRYEPPHMPAFEIVETTWREQMQRVHDVIVTENEKHNWDRTITWISFPDDTRGNKRFRITCTAGDLFTQLALHEMHHRAQVMAMFRELDRPLQDIDYNNLMFKRMEVPSEKDL